jgi:hypothetical protein
VALDLVVCPIEEHVASNGKRVIGPRIRGVATRDYTCISDVRDNGRPEKTWALCRVNTWLNRTAAEQDPNVLILPPRRLDETFGADRNSVRSKLLSLDANLSLQASDTLEILLRRLGTGLSQSAGFDPTQLVIANSISGGSGRILHPISGGAAVFTDDFNRADSDTVSATNWGAEISGGGTGADLDILTNQLRGVSKGSGSFALIGTTTTAHAAIADCYSQITQVQSGGDGAAMVRLTEYDATPTMYVCNVFSNTIETLRYNNSSSSTSLQSSAVTSANNGVIKLQVTGSGATVTLKAYYQGSQVGADISDTNASRITAAGQTGVVIYTIGADGDYDDFSVDDLTGGATTAVVVRALMTMGMGR